ncbi:MAG: hypothetical protein PHQ41_11520 [Candidatus Cloacimonetes bacterium]|nr:hypothetical protein [Candidatus Cloacimonadota bacterium]
MNKAIQKIGLMIWYAYFVITILAVPIFNWRYAREHGFVSWICLGEVVATFKAAVWPYYAFTAVGERAGAGGTAMTSEEMAFAKQWNQWLEDNPKVRNDLRTRAIADNMTEEEISREMIGLMVRFSNEANMDIPQRFIDDLKKR